MSEIQVFHFQNQKVRNVLINDQVWWVAKDIAKVLEYPNTQTMTRRLEDYEKGVQKLHTLGGNQRFTVINESGFYNAIIGSNKPQAKIFKKWVTSEILPSIRRTGNYNIRPPMENPRVSDIKNYFMLETGLSDHILGSKEVILDSAIRIIDYCCRDNEFSNIRTEKTSKGTAYCVDDLMMQMFKAIPHYIKNLTIKNNEKRMAKDGYPKKSLDKSEVWNMLMVGI